MKVLYVDLEFDYGVKSRGLNVIGQLGFVRAFKDLGYQLDSFYYDDYLTSNQSLLQEDLIKKALEFKPDLIFFNLFGDQFSFDTLDKLKKDFTTICWFGDDTWRFDSFSSHYAPHFSYIITTDKWSAHKYYHLLPQERVIVSQWASMPFQLGDSSTRDEFEFDVSFIGGAHDERKWFVKQLQKSGISVSCFGHGWKNGSISNERMSQVFRSSKISLNLSNSRSMDIRFLASSLKSLYRGWKSAKTASQIKARNFEIPFCGGFQITDYAPGIEDYFEIGKEIVCFKDVDEAIWLIKHYLKFDNERELIRSKSIDRVRSMHTYKNRVEDIMKRIEWN